MSAQLMQQGRPSYASGDLHKGTTEEMAIAAEGYLAYSGRFELDEANSTVYHTMEVSMNPTWLGDTQPREFTLKDNILSIINGNNRNQKLVWERVK
ncbi:lipocalin-like domain-containing protein [Staphylococcus nepalensis]|uniref:lipocalin-like domain-containing protein n=1 Tax=Staphylococcus nepalensis TaxID=214473 RepID=UPI0024B88BA5|nr:lipocalin-like domain-containing protein [Staphylococcus nepalensis]